MHYYQFNIGDYYSHTRGLSLFEDIAYRRMIDEYFLSERPFNGCSTDVARLIGMSDYRETVDYVLARFFREQDNNFIHDRIEKDLSAYESRVESASKAGKASGVARRNKGNLTGVDRLLNERSTTVADPLNQPITNNQEPITNIKDNTMSDKSDDLPHGKPDQPPPPRSKINGHRHDCIAILEFLNTKQGSSYRPVEANLKLIAARLAEGYEVQDVKCVIARKVNEWGGTSMAKFIRPKTLFNQTNFANYVGELGTDLIPHKDKP